MVPVNERMGKENKVAAHSGVELSQEEECNPVIDRKIDGTEDIHIIQNKPDLERQMSHDFSRMWNLKRKKGQLLVKSMKEGRVRKDKEGMDRIKICYKHEKSQCNLIFNIINIYHKKQPIKTA